MIHLSIEYTKCIFIYFVPLAINLNNILYSPLYKAVVREICSFMPYAKQHVFQYYAFSSLMIQLFLELVTF